MDPIAPKPVTFLRSPVRWLVRKLGVNFMSLVALLVVGLALLLAFKGKAIFNAVETYRANRIATEASKYLEAERWEMASRLLQDGIRRMPNQVPLMRGVADLFARGFNDPQTAIAFLRRVIATPEVTPADRRRLAEVLLQSGDATEARRMFNELPESEQTGRKGLELLASITRASGRTAEADSILRRALSLTPDDREAQLRLAIMDEAAALDNARAAPVEAIWNIARQKDKAALSAIEHLTGIDTLTATQVKELQSLIESHPLASERQRYIVLHTVLRLRPLDHSQIVNAEIVRNKGRSPDAMFDFLRWLGTEGEHQRVLDLVPADAVARDPDVFLVYVDALASSEKWRELLNLMTTRKVPVTQATSQVILAQCYSKLEPNLKEARRQLLGAIASGRGEIPVLMRVAALADALHLTDIAIQAYKIIAEARPAMRLALLEKLLELHRTDQDVPSMLQTLQQLHELRPRNRSYSDQLNYLRLVTCTQIELAYDQVIGFQEPVNETISTAVVPLPVLRALAALRFGDDARVRQEVDAITDVDRMSAGVRAVVSGLYAITGHDVEAFRIGEKIRRPLLIADEVVFLRRGLAN